MKDTERDGRICAMPGLEPPMDPPTPQQATTQHIDSRSTPLPPDSHQRCRNPAAAQPQPSRDTHPIPTPHISSPHPPIQPYTHVHTHKYLQRNPKTIVTSHSSQEVASVSASVSKYQISNSRLQPSPAQTIPYHTNPARTPSQLAERTGLNEYSNTRTLPTHYVSMGRCG